MKMSIRRAADMEDLLEREKDTGKLKVSELLTNGRPSFLCLSSLIWCCLWHALPSLALSCLFTELSTHDPFDGTRNYPRPPSDAQIRGQARSSCKPPRGVTRLLIGNAQNRAKLAQNIPKPLPGRVQGQAFCSSHAFLIKIGSNPGRTGHLSCFGIFPVQSTRRSQNSEKLSRERR